MNKSIITSPYMPFVVRKKALTESINGSSDILIVEGVLQRADAKNQNGRIYPKKILKREIDRYKNTEIKENRAYGELDHPDRQIVEFHNTSHIIRDVWWEGNDVIGKVEILPTTSGDILKALIERNCAVGISSRGAGSVKQLGEDTVVVESDFELICWDFVSNPSTHGAFMARVNEGKSNLNEGKEFKKAATYSKIHNIMSDIICDIDGVCKI